MLQFVPLRSEGVFLGFGPAASSYEHVTAFCDDDRRTECLRTCPICPNWWCGCCTQPSLSFAVSFPEYDLHLAGQSEVDSGK